MTAGTKYPLQIERFDAKAGFVEVCEAFAIEKIKIGFRKYDAGKEAGSRITDEVDIYFSMNDAALLSRFMLNGGVSHEISRVKQEAERAGTAPNWNIPLWKSRPGGSNKNGTVTYRDLKLFKSSNAAVAVAGFKGPGQTTKTGGIMPAGGMTSQIYIPLGVDAAKAFAIALERAVRMYDTYILMKHFGVIAEREPQNNTNSPWG